VTSSEVQPQAHLVVWGTDVNVVETKEKFKDFLKYFMDDLEQEGEEEPMDGTGPYYIDRLDEVWWVWLCSINLWVCTWLFAHVSMINCGWGCIN